MGSDFIQHIDLRQDIIDRLPVNLKRNTMSSPRYNIRPATESDRLQWDPLWQGWSEVYWHTQNHNSVARGLYDKITGGTDGFVNYTIDVAGLAG